MSDSTKVKVLFIQLPQADNDLKSPRENVHMAAACLSYSLERAMPGGSASCVVSPPGEEMKDDRGLVDFIVSARPDVVAATLYLWNVERTIRVSRMAAGRLPGLKVAVGGPEVHRDHPFLFRSGAADCAVEGEGEVVFPEIVRLLAAGRRKTLPGVGWRTRAGRYSWGPAPAGARVGELSELLPPADHWSNRPDGNGMAYLETGRGCPMNCAFCCYNQRRRAPVYLAPGEVARRVGVLRRRGAREIRFVDPTFNSSPHFEETLKMLARINRDGRIAFFAEIRADTLTERQALLLARANFTEIEVGVQSRDRSVLRSVGREAGVDGVDRGIRLMSRLGIRLTIDIMCGLPRQSLGDVKSSLVWASGFKRVYVQFLHTLLLPGTRLRDRRRALGLKSQACPPYRVLSTPTMRRADFMAAERLAAKIGGESVDAPSRRFVGRRLPDLFPERIRVRAADIRPAGTVSGSMLRRAVIFEGNDLYSNRDRIVGLMRRSVREEPNVLWQFVLRPEGEEPFDLLDDMIGAIGNMPRHFLDRQVVSADGLSRFAARRVMILLRQGRRYGRSWVSGAEAMLGNRFH